jgi:hypothetical protein
MDMQRSQTHNVHSAQQFWCCEKQVMSSSMSRLSRRSRGAKERSNAHFKSSPTRTRSKAPGPPQLMPTQLHGWTTAEPSPFAGSGMAFRGRRADSPALKRAHPWRPFGMDGCGEHDMRMLLQHELAP